MGGKLKAMFTRNDGYSYQGVQQTNWIVRCRKCSLELALVSFTPQAVFQTTGRPKRKKTCQLLTKTFYKRRKLGFEEIRQSSLKGELINGILITYKREENIRSEISNSIPIHQIPSFLQTAAKNLFKGAVGDRKEVAIIGAHLSKTTKKRNIESNYAYNASQNDYPLPTAWMD